VAKASTTYADCSYPLAVFYTPLKLSWHSITYVTGFGKPEILLLFFKFLLWLWYVM